LEVKVKIKKPKTPTSYTPSLKGLGGDLSESKPPSMKKKKSTFASAMAGKKC
jgi:hypothetical protein